MELMTDEKKGLKRTEVGEIPEDWKVSKLGSKADVKTGPFGSTLHKEDYVEYGTPIITVEHIGGSNITTQNLPTVSEFDYKRLKTYQLKQGDIVFSRVGSIDRNSYVTEKEDGWLFSGRLLRIRVIDDSLSPEYLSYYFDQHVFKERIREVAVGQTMPSLNTQILNNITISSPPTIKEQQAIAEALSDVDELIRSLDRLIQKKEAIKKGTMQQLLTGKKRLPGFDGEWEVKKLGDVCQIISGGTPSTRNSEYWDGNIDWCTPTDITSNKGKYLSKTSRKITKQGLKNSSASLLPKDTLLLCSRATVGEIKIATSQISTNQGFKSLICSDFVDNEFLYYLIILKKQKFIDKAFGSTFLEISKKNTSEIEFELPSTKEQKAIAQILSDMDQELQTLRQKREKYKQIKQGMMQELLTGKTRLV